MSTHSETDQQIIELMQQQDKRAMELIYDKYSSALYGVILKILKSEPVAQDVLQDVCIKVWKNAEKYDPAKGKLFTWLLNIARNTSIDKLRSTKFQQNRKSVPTDLNVYNSVNLTTETPVNHIGLQKVVQSLDKKYRMIIDLIYFQGYTQREVEDELNIPLGTVKSRVRIALRELRSILKTDN